MKRIVLFAWLTLAAGLVVAADYRPLSGDYAITGPTLLDPPPDEQQDRVVLFLQGDAARDVYRGMTIAEVPAMCNEGARTKSAGGMECMFDPNDDTYVCWIGLRLDSGQAVHADVPC